MVPYSEWSKLQCADAFFQPESVLEVLNKRFTGVADNVWLGTLYGPLPLRHDYMLTARLYKLLRDKKAFSLLKAEGDRYSFALRNDPKAEEIIEQQIHTKIHSQRGSLSKVLPLQAQS